MENPYQKKTDSLYQSGTSVVSQGQSTSSNIVATNTSQSMLYSSKGWVRFISVLGFIYFSILLLVLLGALIFSGYFGVNGANLFVSFLVLIITITIFMIALRLSKYASSIGRMEFSRSAYDLENAMIQQMKFWRVAAVLSVLVLIFLLCVILF